MLFNLKDRRLAMYKNKEASDNLYFALSRTLYQYTDNYSYAYAHDPYDLPELRQTLLDQVSFGISYPVILIQTDYLDQIGVPNV